MKTYKEKVAVITGGTSGLGYAIAERIGQDGCHVVITGRNAVKGEKAVQALQAKGIDVTYAQHDTSEEESWDAMLKTVLAKYPTVDYLFNNAGVMMRPKPNIKLTMKDWKWVIDTNMWGPLYGLRKFSNLMLTQENGGRIITTASTATVAPFSMWAPYSVSKAAVTRIVECFQSESNMLKLDKVKYHISFPGVFESDVSNGTVYKDEKYINEGEVEKAEPSSKAGTLEGDKLGKITADDAARMILEQVDEGKFYIYTHEDLTFALIQEQVTAMLENKPVVDQAVYDFAFYAKRLASQGVDVGGASRLEQMSREQG